jgi:hypothetical protein
MAIVTKSCVVCDKRVYDRQKGIYCDCFTKWVHLKCTDLVNAEYDKLSLNPNDDWYCAKCISSIFPFGSVDDDIEFANCLFNHSNGLITNTKCINSVEQLCLTSKTLKIDENFDPDKNYLNATYTKVKYLSEAQFNVKLTEERYGCNFSILHLNARSTEPNMDKVLLLINGLQHNFSVIAVTESWATELNEEFLEIDGYTMINKNRTSKKGGGVALYIDESLTLTKQDDLSMIHNDFECVFS